MLKLRFDPRALASGALLVSLFLLVEMRLGIWGPPLARDWTLDRSVVQVVLVGLLYAAAFAAGDVAAVRAGRRSRAVYTAIGAAAALPAALVGLGGEALIEAAQTGALTLFLAAPALAGAASGFLYHRRAGYETVGDDPAELAAALAPEAEPAAGPVAPVAFGTKGTVATASAEYFGGPLQVKSSVMALLIAAMVGGAFHTLMNFTSLIGDPLPADALPPTLRNNPALGVVYGMIGLAIPYILFVRTAHGYLQRRGKAELRSYGAAGLIVPLAFGAGFTVLMGPMGFLMAAQFILPSIAAMLTYHVLAGLEPLALPDDIEVSDRRALLAADHPRRRMRRMVVTDR